MDHNLLEAQEPQESKPCPGPGLAGTGQDLGEQPRMGGWPQPCIPAPASSPGASEVPFPWAQMDRTLEPWIRNEPPV